MQSVNEYYSAVQLRSDRWAALREATDALAQGGNDRHIAAVKKRVEQLWTALEVIEPYWAFPGMQAFDYMRRQYASGHFEDLA